MFAVLSPLAYSEVHPQEYSDLPDLYQKAFTLSAGLTKNAKLELLLETFGGYSVYKDKLKIQSDGFAFTLKSGTSPLKGVDPISHKLKDFYKGQNEFIYDISSRESSLATPSQIIVKLQACSKENCLLPVAVKVPIQTTPVMSASKIIPPPATSQDWTEKVKTILGNSTSILSPVSLLILFLAGLLTAFSPCVLPMFPITLGIFSRWTHHNNRKAMGLSIAYGGGIILCYAVHGLISAATGGIFGSLTQSPLYLVGIGTTILISGFIFSGLVPFPFANFFLQVAGRVSGGDAKQSYQNMLIKSFVMGATLGLVASPCVGPILVTLLALLSRELPSGNVQSYFAGFFALSMFGVGMALPFLILGHFYFRLQKRVQLGKYSPLVKYFGSALLIGGSLFFLVPGIKIMFPNENSRASSHGVSWEQRPQGRWLIVDFRADWCTACVEIENEMLGSPDVQSAMKSKDWDLVSVDMTDADKNVDLAKKFEVLSLPTLIFISPNNKVCKSFTLNEKESVPKFILRLEKAKDECS